MELLQFWYDTDVVIDEGIADYHCTARRAYYQMRGKRVTEEQALDIISRTDRYAPWNQELSYNDRFVTRNFSNKWLPCGPHHELSGWVHPNGIVGIDDTAGKCPFLMEFVDDCIALINEFPYLDFVVAVTWWDQMPPYAWDLIRFKNDNYREEHKYDEYPDFLDNIEVGFWVHDRTIEVMSPERTAVVYSEYDKKYSEKDHRIYSPHYYMDFQPDVISDDFVAKCCKAYGYDGIPESSEWLKKNEPLTDLNNSDIISDETYLVCF